MKKTLSILNKSITLASLPPLVMGVALPAVLATVKLFQPINARKAVPENWLKIESNTLYGFQDWVTASQLRKEGFNTLAIPKQIERVAPYAFAYILDGKANEIKTVELNVTNLKSIGKGAFAFCYGIEKLLNFESCEVLETIEQDAFTNCKRLGGDEDTNLIIPSCLKSIGYSAFRDCEKIDYLTIPSTLEEMGDYAFDNCLGLSAIYVDTDGLIPQWAGRKSYAFIRRLGETAPMVFIPNLEISVDEWKNIFINNLGTTDDVDIVPLVSETDESYFNLENGGETLVSIKDNFFNLPVVSVIKIPDSVKTIKEGAFEDVLVANKGYWRLELNENLVTIEEDAFSGCTGLYAELTIPDTVESIGAGAFKNTNIYGTLTLPKNDSYIKVEKSTFEGTKIRKLVLPPQFQQGSETTDQIVFDNDCFDDCIFLGTLDVSSFNSFQTPRWKGPDGTPFSNVQHRGMVIYPYNATVMDPINNISPRLKAIKLCDSAEDVNQCWMPYEPTEAKPKPFPYDVKGDRAFYINGEELVGLSDEYKAEMENYNLIKIPVEAQTVGYQAFKNVFHDENITKPTDSPTKRWQLSFDFGVKTIESYAFENCELIVGDVVLPSTLETIGDHAFVQANSITSFKIPKSVQSIGRYAFEQRAPYWEGGPKLKFIDLTDFDVSDIQSLNWDINALRVTSDISGNIYIKSNTKNAWIAKGFDLSDNWSFKEVA